MQLGSCKHDLPAFTVRHLYNKTALVSLFKRRRLNLRGTTLVAVIRPLNHPCRPGTLFSSHSYPRWHETIWITVINRPDLHRPFALDPAAPGEPSVSVCTASHHPAALCASPGTYSFPSLHVELCICLLGNLKSLLRDSSFASSEAKMISDRITQFDGVCQVFAGIFCVSAKFNAHFLIHFVFSVIFIGFYLFPKIFFCFLFVRIISRIISRTRLNCLLHYFCI